LNRRKPSETRIKWLNDNKENLKIKKHQYYLDHIEAIKRRTSEYAKAHPEIQRKSGAKWRKNNPDKVKTLGTKYRKENPEAYNAKYARWAKKHWANYYYKNKTRILKQTRTYEKNLQINNPEKYKAIKKETNRRRRNIPRNKLNDRISVAIWRSLRNSKSNRHWETLVDFNLEQLIEHLEKQFKPDMTWGNYGQWHIDHKLPVASFNIDSEKSPDFKKCWALKNLQPLWKEENLKKGAKINHEFLQS
jgi:hypothetical protein